MAHGGSYKTNDTFHGIFIRAPGIVSIENEEDVKILATLCENHGGAQRHAHGKYTVCAT